MKNDALFKFTVLVILAGVIAAFIAPSPPPAAKPIAAEHRTTVASIGAHAD